MTSYRKQPQSTSDVYRDVHMSASGKFNAILSTDFLNLKLSLLADYERDGISAEDNDVTSMYSGPWVSLNV